MSECLTINRKLSGILLVKMGKVDWLSKCVSVKRHLRQTIFGNKILLVLKSSSLRVD